MIHSACKKPILIIHGGAGPTLKDRSRHEQIHDALREIVETSYALLKKGKSARDAAVFAVKLLEDCPLFNAGKGSAIQSDGVIRMSAGLMDGRSLRFSGVVNVRGLKNPIASAVLLQNEKNRVLAGAGAKAFAAEHGLSLGSPYTARARRILQERLNNTRDTVGAVALDLRGRIAAATSTGGMSATYPERVSDTPTVAGNYANAFAGVSVTGVGEQIVDHAVAAAIVTRVEDGLSLPQAMKKTIVKARKFKADFGCIGISHRGEWCSDRTSPYMAWAVKTDESVQIEP